MIKFKITPERFSEACGIFEYLAVLQGDKGTIIQVSPRFIVDEKGEYIMGIVNDDEGDIQEFTNRLEAVKKLEYVTPKRLEKLVFEFTEAAKGIVNPTNAGDLKEQ